PFDDDPQLRRRVFGITTSCELCVGLLHGSSKCLCKQLLLAIEVSIKASVRELEFTHQIGDGNPSTAVTTKTARSCAYDAPVCLSFTVCRISRVNRKDDIHRFLSVCRQASGITWCQA